MAALIVPDGVPAYLARYGFPIRYGYVKQPWPASMYQTVFANEIGERGNAVGGPAVHA